MGHTAIEKIAAAHAVGLRPGAAAPAGSFVTIRPRHVMTHDNTGAVIPKFRSIGATRVHDPRQPVFAIDHDIQNVTPENLGKYAKIAAFAREHGIDFYPPGRGIAHQVMVEEGYVTPGSLVVGSDSHSNLYGAIGALGTPVVRTDAAALWATGRTWWQVPPIARVTLTGSLRRGATGKDVIITLCGLFRDDEVLNHAVEFAGDGVAGLSVDERMTIANMTTEWGALAGVFPMDGTLRAWLAERARFFERRGGRRPYTEADVARWWDDRASYSADPDASYAKELTLDLSTVSPHVSGPNSVKVMTPVAAMRASPVRIDKAYLMSCVNARLSDLEAAARVFGADGGPVRRVAPGVRLYIAAASSEVEREASARGWWGVLLEAGAIPLPAGCGACIGLGAGTLEPGEVGISATNRNFQGRMGSRDARCYLASPEVVAESACRGHIAAPDGEGVAPVGACEVRPRRAAAGHDQEILDGFPRRVEGRALLVPRDNLDTDGIYGKDVTYRDDIAFEEQGRHAMLNYDPAFQSVARSGDILVAGANFGCGSSREQAATALASRGIRVVIAASAGQTYSRNAFNNGFVVIECPELVDALRARHAGEVAAGERTIAGPVLTVDFVRSRVTCEGAAYAFGALSTTAQELVVAGGSEAVVRALLGAGV